MHLSSYQLAPTLDAHKQAPHDRNLQIKICQSVSPDPRSDAGQPMHTGVLNRRPIGHLPWVTPKIVERVPSASPSLPPTMPRSPMQRAAVSASPEPEVEEGLSLAGLIITAKPPFFVKEVVNPR